MDHNDLIVGAISGLFLSAIAIDIAVSYTDENRVSVGFSSRAEAWEVYQGLLASGHSATLDDGTVEVRALQRGGCRPNQAAWMLWEEVNHLAVIIDARGFHFGERWYSPNAFAQPRRLDWATPPHLTSAKWWGAIARKILGIS
jgi:hypothetical protein